MLSGLAFKDDPSVVIEPNKGVERAGSRQPPLIAVIVATKLTIKAAHGADWGHHPDVQRAYHNDYRVEVGRENQDRKAFVRREFFTKMAMASTI